MKSTLAIAMLGAFSVFFSKNAPGNAVTGGTQCSQGANTALTAPSRRRGTARHHNTAFPAPAHGVVDLSARL